MEPQTLSLITSPVLLLPPSTQAAVLPWQCAGISLMQQACTGGRWGSPSAAPCPWHCARAKCPPSSISNVPCKRQMKAVSFANGESPGEVPHGVAVEQAAKFPSEEMKQLKQELQSRSGAKLVLGIETSCDDTGVAVVSTDGHVLGEALATQAEIHALWGGVVPNLAREGHRAAIDRTVEQALSRAGVTAEQLDAIAVTVGPGLSLCLRVGVVKAEELAALHQKPLLRIHHMEAHALVARLNPDEQARPTFPYLCLLVSGGHNLLVLVRGIGHYVQLGTTLDDAIGEAYDKVARLLGLDQRPSGGAAVEALAREGDPVAYKFVLPMKKYVNCDFSYAGLKNSVRKTIEETLGSNTAAALPLWRAPTGHAAEILVASLSSSTAHTNNVHTEGAGSGEGSGGQQGDAGSGGAQAGSTAEPGSQGSAGSSAEDPSRRKIKADIAASFQAVATQHLVDRVHRAIVWTKESDPTVRHLVVSGGVACNQFIRAKLQQEAESTGLQLVLPKPSWCTDNGVMVGWAGVERLKLGFQEPPLPAQDFGRFPVQPHIVTPQRRVVLPASLRHAHLPQLSIADSPAQVLAMTCHQGKLLEGSLRKVQLIYDAPKWRMVGAERSHINHKLLSGWSVLAAPPTGSIVQVEGKQHYQPAPGQPLQGPLAASLVLVLHTQDPPTSKSVSAAAAKQVAPSLASATEGEVPVLLAFSVGGVVQPGSLQCARLITSGSDYVLRGMQHRQLVVNRVIGWGTCSMQEAGTVLRASAAPVRPQWQDPATGAVHTLDSDRVLVLQLSGMDGSAHLLQPQTAMGSGLQGDNEGALSSDNEEGEGMEDNISEVWVEVWPRWPLTTLKHPQAILSAQTPVRVCQPGCKKPIKPSRYGVASGRKARVRQSLTSMTLGVEEEIGQERA